MVWFHIIDAETRCTWSVEKINTCELNVRACPRWAEIARSRNVMPWPFSFLSRKNMRRPLFPTASVPHHYSQTHTQAKKALNGNQSERPGCVASHAGNSRTPRRGREAACGPMAPRCSSFFSQALHLCIRKPRFQGLYTRTRKMNKKICSALSVSMLV